MEQFRLSTNHRSVDESKISHGRSRQSAMEEFSLQQSVRLSLQSTENRSMEELKISQARSRQCAMEEFSLQQSEENEK